MTVQRPYPGDVVADAIDQPFWDACRHGRFLVFRCHDCGTCFWPAGACPRHGHRSMFWSEAAGTGALHTWTVMHQRYSASFDDAPGTIAVVALDESLLFHTALIDHDPARLSAGMPVEVTYVDIGGGVVLPYFRPRVTAV